MPSVDSIPTAAMPTPYSPKANALGLAKSNPLANPNDRSVAAPVISTGAHVLSMPSAMPPMMIVAGPVRA